ncbi:MAG: long-chain fatty acid--CoA ligase [Bacteroidales bacterium]
MEIERTFDLLDHLSNRNSSEIALAQKRRGKWLTYTIEEYINNTRYIGSSLLFHGIKKGDRIASITNDRPEWNFIDLGVQMIGAIHIPIAFTSEEKVVEYILQETEARVVFISNRVVFIRLKKILSKLPKVEMIISFININECEDFANFLVNGKDSFDPAKIKSIKDTISPDDLGAILYTSGTSSQPKGVMLTHRNLCMVFQEFPKLFSTNPGSNALSVLPLSHIGARKMNYVYQFKGLPVYYSDSNSNIIDVLKEVKPEFTAFVPFLLDKIHSQILRSSFESKGLKKWLAKYAYQLTQEFDINNKSLLFSLKHIFFNYLYYKKWRQESGGKLRNVICGGASVAESLLKFYWAIGVPVYEVYGLTETTSLVSTNRPKATKFGTVGKAYTDIEVTTDNSSEIICKGDNITVGYYKKPELTKRDIDENGFFHTGDLGVIDEDGFIKITGRKKEIFKTASGDYVAPEMIENKIKQSTFISQAMVYGANMEYLSTLIVPDFESLENWAKTNNISYTDYNQLIQNEAVKKLLSSEINKYHTAIIDAERIERIKLLTHKWSVETGELSSLMKLKRNYILKKHKSL